MDRKHWLHRISLYGCVLVAVFLVADIVENWIEMSKAMSLVQFGADLLTRALGSPVPVTYDWPLTSLSARACLSGETVACMSLPNYRLYIIILVIALVADLGVLVYGLRLYEATKRRLDREPENQLSANATR